MFNVIRIVEKYDNNTDPFVLSLRSALLDQLAHVHRNLVHERVRAIEASIPASFARRPESLKGGLRHHRHAGSDMVSQLRQLF